MKIKIFSEDNLFPDREDWLRNMNSLYRQLEEGWQPKDPQVLCEGLNRRLRRGNLFLVCVLDGDRIIATASIYFEGMTALHDNGWIADVVVDKEYLRRGLADKLQAELFEKAVAWDAPFIDLSSGRDRKAARKLYAKHGFRLRDSDLFRFNL